MEPLRRTRFGKPTNIGSKTGIQQRSSPLEVRVQKNVRSSLKWCLAKGFWILLCPSKKSICTNLKRYVFHLFCLNTTVGWSWWHVVSFFSKSFEASEQPHWISLPCDSSISETYGFRKPFACAFTCVNVPWIIFCHLLFHLSNLHLVQCDFFGGYQQIEWCEHGEPPQVSQCHYTDPNMPFANPSSQLCEEPCNASLLGETYSDTVSENIQFAWYVKPLVSWNVPGEQHWGLWRAGRCSLQFTFSLWN